jgi:hypothetical protein
VFDRGLVGSGLSEENIVPIRGSCHCGRIAYSLDAEPTEAIECNCSICRRRGSVLAAFTPDKFHLETSRDDIAVYTFNRHAIRHQLQDLRLRAFRRGDWPQWHGDGGDQSPLRRRRPCHDQNHEVRRGEPLGLLGEHPCP